MFKIYYLWGRRKIKESLKKEIAKYDKKEAEKISFAEFDDVIGKQFRPDQAINNLIKQLELQEGNIYLTRLDTEKLLEKAKKIAILSYSDYVNRVNTKLLAALDTGVPYRTFIKLLEADQIKDLSVKSLVDVKNYWEVVYSTNLATMFGSGFNDQRDEVKEFLYGEQYNAVMQKHLACKAQAGEIREIGGFAATGTEEPNGYRCSGYRTVISKVRAEALGIKLTPKNKRSTVKADKGFRSSITPNKVNNLPKTVTNRLPDGYTKVM